MELIGLIQPECLGTRAQLCIPIVHEEEVRSVEEW
jgi:hypothetical protein